MNIHFDNTYARLPERFYSSVKPEPSSKPETIAVDEALARQLGFEPAWLTSEEGAQFVVGNSLLEGSEPIALVYAGHQFGNWVPRLGDGRAVLIGEVLDESDERFDLQLKGSGRTPYSRRGDGRAPLGPILREFLVAKAMAAMGIATTRVLAAASTGDTVLREQSLPGAVLVRVARSHLRIGTFEYFASKADSEAIELLVDYAIDRHYPQLQPGSAIALFEAVADRTARLVAKWQLFGFIHGVMNTDNMLICGETIDYGPCAFMNQYDPETVYSSIDRHGRYAYGNQPAIAQWNLSRFARSLLPAHDGEEQQEQFLDRAQEVIDEFPEHFRDAYIGGMTEKLGFSSFQDEDWELITDLLELMYETNSDYTLAFRGLTELADLEGKSTELFALDDAFDPWLKRWRERLDVESIDPEKRHAKMAATNPVFIPRNHLVEEALQSAVEHQNYEPFHELEKILEDPFTYRSSHERFARPPKPEERIAATFCGT